MKIEKIINKVIATSLSLIMGISSTYATGGSAPERNLKEKVSKSQKEKEETKKRWVNNSILFFLSLTIAGTSGIAAWANITEGNKIEREFEKASEETEEARQKAEEEIGQSVEEEETTKEVLEEKRLEEVPEEARYRTEEEARHRTKEVRHGVKEVRQKVTVDEVAEEESRQIDKIINDLNQQDIEQNGQVLQQLIYENNKELFNQVILHMDDIGKRMNVKMDINSQDKYGQTALIAAVEYNIIDDVKLLLSRNDIDVNKQDNEGKTALMYAVECMRMQRYKDKVKDIVGIVGMLLDRDDIDVSKKDNFGKTALMYAVECMNRNADADIAAVKNIVGMLLNKKGIRVDEQDNFGRTAFMSAMGNLDVAKILLSKGGIDVNKQDNKGETALMRSIKYNQNIAAVELLISIDGIDVNKQDNEGKTALIWAIDYENARAIELLLSKGAIKENGYKYNDYTPLQYAVEKYSKMFDGEDANGGRIIGLLLCEEGDANTVKPLGEKIKYVLMWVSKNDKIDPIKKLLFLESIEEDYWINAFKEAIENKSMNVIELLVNRKDNINWVKSWDDEVLALTCALKSREKDIIKMVLKRMDMEDDEFDCYIEEAILYSIKQGLDEEVIDLFLEIDGLELKLENNYTKEIYNPFSGKDSILEYNDKTELGDAVYYRGKWVRNRLKKYLERQKNKEGSEEDGSNSYDTIEKIMTCRGEGKRDFEILEKVMQEENVELFQEVLKINGLNVNDQSDDQSETVLTYAIQNSPVKIVKLLLEHPEINPNLPNKNGQTPLWMAIDMECIDAIKLLLKHSKIDVNLVDYPECNPLHCAISLVVDHKRVRIVDKDRKVKILKLLMNRPEIDVNPVDNDSFTPLMRLVMHGGNEDLIEELLRQYPKIDVNVEGRYGCTALKLALESSYKKAVEILSGYNKVNVNIEK